MTNRRLTFVRLIALGLLLSCLSLNGNAMQTIPKWGVFEESFTTSQTFDNPLLDCRTEVTFTAPSGTKHLRLAFWDGGSVWKVRFSPTETGEWSYQTKNIKGNDSSLDGNEVSFICTPSKGASPFEQHGPIHRSNSRRYLAHADGTPFFWLADTVWNGALMADTPSWETFLSNRQAKRFTAIQFVATQWRAAPGDRVGQTAFEGIEKIEINPSFFKRMDRRLIAINQHNMIASPVLLWAINGKENPGSFLPEDQKIALAEYMTARWGAYQVVWILGGDGQYRKEKSKSWQRVGRAIFGDHPHRLAVMHPGGGQWVGNEFRNELWTGFLGYQSGHGDSEKTQKWLLQGPPAKEWNTEPLQPVINMEPNYEAHNGYTFRKVHGDFAVRRASYWSLMIAPPAGITYGVHGVWGWHEKAQKPMNHSNSGFGLPWNYAMHLPGSLQMMLLRDFFDSVAWWKLIPRPERLLDQPGDQKPQFTITIAETKTLDTLVAYIPDVGSISLNTQGYQGANAQWFDPRTGGWINIGPVTEPQQSFTLPDRNDWLLRIMK